MGAWGVNSFENDSALDFIADIEEQGSALFLEQIDFVAKYPEEDFLEAPDAEQVLVALEIIAVVQGNPSKNIPEGLSTWIEKNGPKEVGDTTIELSHKALDRVLSNNSELKELWEDSDEYSLWEKNLKDLKERIG